MRRPSKASASGPGSSPKSSWSRRSASTCDSWKSPERDPQDRWGRAAARTLPTRVGTGCRPSVIPPRVGGIGSTPNGAMATGAPSPCPGQEFRLQAPGPHTMRGRVDARSWTRQAPTSRAVCDAPHAEGNSATPSTSSRHFRRPVRHSRSHPHSRPWCATPDVAALTSRPLRDDGSEARITEDFAWSPERCGHLMPRLRA